MIHAVFIWKRSREADGQGALNAVEKAQYDLILMDIQMQDTLKTVNSNTQLAKALDARS